MKIEYLIFGSYILSSYISKVIMMNLKNFNKSLTNKVWIYQINVVTTV